MTFETDPRPLVDIGAQFGQVGLGHDCLSQQDVKQACGVANPQANCKTHIKYLPSTVRIGSSQNREPPKRAGCPFGVSFKSTQNRVPSKEDTSCGYES